MHQPLAAVAAPSSEGELTLAKRLWPRVPNGSLVIGDRGFGSPRTLHEAMQVCDGREVAWLVRVRKDIKVRLVRRLPDGSALVEVPVREDNGARNAPNTKRSVVREFTGEALPVTRLGGNPSPPQNDTACAARHGFTREAANPLIPMTPTQIGPRGLRSALMLTLVLAVPSIGMAAERALLDAEGNPAGFRALAIGDAAPDFSLPGIDGRTYSLADFGHADVLMVLFTSNHCPTSHGIEKRLQKLRDDLRGESFALVAINPNHPEGLSIDELGFGEYSDSFEDMKPYAENNGWDFPYLYDGETQMTARAYGCLATPHVFVFDRERRLRYAGRFDDSRFPQESTVQSPDARNAVQALLAGRPVPVELTRPHGCSTKWREKRATNIKIEAAWKSLPVVMERIDAAGVARLRANGSNKYRLVNVWATWCAPCVEEFPVLVSLSRQYDMREFELVTISLDKPEHEARATAFLKRQGAGVSKRVQPTVEKEGRTTNHYLFTGASQDELVAALDPEWPGPVPHTVLVAPGGEILWRHTGIIDHVTARAEIVKALTPYYSPPDSE